MKAVAAYIGSHWRGEQGIERAILLNLALGYGIVVALALLLAQAGQPGIYAFLLLFGVWAVWAAVGVIRSAAKSARAPGSGWVNKTLAVVVGGAMVAFVAGTLSDLYRLIYP